MQYHWERMTLNNSSLLFTCFSSLRWMCGLGNKKSRCCMSQILVSLILCQFLSRCVTAHTHDVWWMKCFCVNLQAEELSPGISKTVRLYIAKVLSDQLISHCTVTIYGSHTLVLKSKLTPYSRLLGSSVSDFYMFAFMWVNMMSSLFCEKWKFTLNL